MSRTNVQTHTHTPNPAVCLVTAVVEKDANGKYLPMFRVYNIETKEADLRTELDTKFLFLDKSFFKYNIADVAKKYQGTEYKYRTDEMSIFDSVGKKIWSGPVSKVGELKDEKGETLKVSTGMNIYAVDESGNLVKIVISGAMRGSTIDFIEKLPNSNDWAFELFVNEMGRDEKKQLAEKYKVSNFPPAFFSFGVTENDKDGNETKNPLSYSVEMGICADALDLTLQMFWAERLGHSLPEKAVLTPEAETQPEPVNEGFAPDIDDIADAANSGDPVTLEGKKKSGMTANHEKDPANDDLPF